MAKKSFTVKEFAKEVNLSERTIRRAIQNKQINANRGQNRRRWSIPASEVEKLKGESGGGLPGPQQARPLEKGMIPDALLKKRLEKHFDQLADVARGILGDLLRNGVYRSEKELTDGLSGNLDAIFPSRFPESLYADFSAHLREDCPSDLRSILEAGGLYELVSEKPNQIAPILERLAERGTFKGTCDICREWL